MYNGQVAHVVLGSNQQTFKNGGLRIHREGAALSHVVRRRVVSCTLAPSTTHIAARFIRVDTAVVCLLIPYKAILLELVATLWWLVKLTSLMATLVPVIHIAILTSLYACYGRPQRSLTAICCPEVRAQ